jgi:23S rRNA (uracil1939-C5)-methyltransferase
MTTEPGAHSFEKSDAPALGVGTRVRLTIEKLVEGGAGIGRLGGRVVFVDRALPGEEVEVEIFQVKRRFARGRTTRVLRESPERVEPPCPHFLEGCGGCQWQNLSYEAQLRAKVEMLQETLMRIGQFQEIPLRDAVPAPRTLDYRNKFGFTQDRGVFGMHFLNSHRVIPIERCLIQEPLLQEIFAILVSHYPLLLRSVQGEGTVREVFVRGSGATREFLVVLRTDRTAVLTAEDLAPWLEALPASVVGVIHDAGKRKSVLLGRNFYWDEVAGMRFRFTHGSFEQSNREQSEALLKTVLDGLPGAARQPVDLYCGVGFLTLSLAKRFGRAVGIECSAAAIADARVSAKENAVPDAAFLEGGVDEHLDALTDSDIVVVDPPRAGLTPRLCARLLKLRPSHLTYVSCNPATLARDLRALVDGGYRLTSLTPIDMFPQTYHVETVAHLQFGNS